MPSELNLVGAARSMAEMLMEVEQLNGAQKVTVALILRQMADEIEELKLYLEVDNENPD
jgi:hypothetical protein